MRLHTNQSTVKFATLTATMALLPFFTLDFFQFYTSILLSQKWRGNVHMFYFLHADT